MSAQHPYIEQDNAPPPGGDDLPTYDDLAAQNGPNSRFGRWRGWIEKRAAERYNDVGPDERARRRARGWGLNDSGSEADEQLTASVQSSLNIRDRQLPSLPSGPAPHPRQQPPPLHTLPQFYQQTALPTPDPYSNIPQPPPIPNLHVQTNNLAFQPLPSPPAAPESMALPFVSQKLPPTHLKLNNFGSRFLPHATAPIRCLLPLPSERLVLIGHDEGLSVLDMFPQEWNNLGGITVKGPDEAQSREIWRGEGVYQMSMLEVEDIGEGTPQGVVLALVGPDTNTCSKDQEATRTLRMYNLSSLTSLAKWAVSQKGTRPLELHRPSNWQAQQSPQKRHRTSHSLAKGLRSLIEPQNASPTQPETSSSSYQRLLSPVPNMLNVTRESTSGRTSPMNGSTTSLNSKANGVPRRVDSVDSSWDIVEDLPLRWATDYVPLASPGSRLVGMSVLFYALWTDDKLDKRVGAGNGGRMLAVSTKSNIFLYETPKGQRAFHFVKEFYTPLQPRAVTFFKQNVQDLYHSASDAQFSRVEPGGLRGVRERRISSTSLASPLNRSLSYDTQLSLFVIFDKKAGWIRLADSAVGEITLPEEAGSSSPLSHSHSLRSRESFSPVRRSRMSMEFGSHSPRWILPVKCELPLPTAQPRHIPTQEVYLVTRGKHTHIMPSPLPSNVASCPPLTTVTWKNAPNHVAPRVCNPAVMGLDMDDIPPYLQLVSMCEDGIEVQEIPLSFLSLGKGKGKVTTPPVESIWTEEDVGGSTGFLCHGGHWDAYSEYSEYGMEGFGGIAPGFGPRFQAHLAGGITRSLSTASDMSFNSLQTEDIALRLKQEQGIYGWCRRGVSDYRVFWVGGSLVQDLDDEEQDI
ncbi:hypothetical protein BDN71DRAFT_353746 [Pleurotus eryngii]|uniref:Uncharacterized protein n=1 Tax=Pleurotus eryngii TaxID=5323 RepID=A0A9P6DA00_PLEER|nr:hypothetical protein BDN71DRAFT_353746 [Pleurotus eryngii]